MVMATTVRSFKEITLWVERVKAEISL